MTRQSIFTLPSCSHPVSLDTARGPFAALEAAPSGDIRGTALLLPGYTGSKDEFIPLFRHLVDAGYRAVAVDGRGQDETLGPDLEKAYRYESLAADVQAQAEALGGPIHLVGHSMGGLVARAAALANSSLFLSLTLLSSGPAAVGGERRAHLKLLLGLLKSSSMTQIWDLMHATRADTASVGDAARLRERWLRNNPTQLLVSGTQLLTEPDRTMELAALEELPKHVVYGENDDTWAPSAMYGMARQLKARLTVIDSAGHSPNLQQLARTAAACTEFWDTLRLGEVAEVP